MTRDDGVRLGLIGFGEAASRFARDLRAAGLTDIFAYSRSAATAAVGDSLHKRADDAGVTLVTTPKELARRANVIICLTPGAAALDAARGIRKYLGPDHLYVDATTASVKKMEKIASLLEGRAKFVDAAIMDAVPVGGIRVRTMASGPHAEEFRARLGAYGMNIKVIGERAGMASAFKLMRSVAMKGLAAVLIEALEAAHRCGMSAELTEDIARYVDEYPFEQLMKRFVCGTAIHADRRAHEMVEATALLKTLRSPARMSRATREKLEDIARLGLRDRFDAREPQTIGSALDALIEARTSQFDEPIRS